MQSSISAYLLALEVLALVALSIGIFNTSTPSRTIKTQTLVALFALVLIRGLLFIGFFSIQPLFDIFRGSLEILSILCLVAVLSKPALTRTQGWYVYLILGGITSLILFLAVLQGIGLPWEPFAVLVGVSGLNLILSRRDMTRWTHAFVPVALALAGLFEWWRFIQLSQFISLLSYGCFIYALFIESSLNMATRQREVESLRLEMNRLQTERRKLLEVGSTLNEADGLDNVLTHMVRTLAQTTEMDQALIINLDTPGSELAYLSALYSLNRVHPGQAAKDVLFHISDSLILAEVIELRQPLCIQDPDQELALADLYGLWREPKLGPTLLQPLWFNKRMVGVLILGNPMSKRPVRRIGQTLCQQLAPQVAAAVYDILQHRSLSQKVETPSETIQSTQTAGNFVQALQTSLVRRMTNINNYADLIAAGTTQNADRQEVDLARMIRAEVEQIREIIQNTWQIQSHSSELHLEEVHVENLLREASERANVLASTKGLEFELKLAQNLPLMQADPDKLRQIVDNLISNACRFTFKPGRIMLRAWVQKSGFDRHEMDYLMIAVYDTGIGISKKARKAIFEPYYQGMTYQDANDTTLLNEGLGLGLAVVKTLVKAHQGRVWVESEMEQGSVFRVALPVRRLDQSILNRLKVIASPQAASPSPHQERQKRRPVQLQR